jgi:hypothetical protein
MNKVLLHTCCGPCATHSLEVLKRDWTVVLFFSNSNIAPREEYERRLEAARELARRCEVALVEDAYDHEAWLTHVRGLESEPEGGLRCERCFGYNLGRAAAYARDHAFDGFTTTLTLSPHKDSNLILRVGRMAGEFVAVDFKKEGGFRHSVELSQLYGLYRQGYCGCEFSLRERRTRAGSSPGRKADG